MKREDWRRCLAGYVPASFLVGMLVLVIAGTGRIQAAEGEAEQVRPVGGGEISGRAVFVGKPPAEKVLPMDAPCLQGHVNPPMTRFYQVSESGGLADVVVRIVGGLPKRNWAAPAQEHILRQEGCLYEPYISAAQAGQTVVVQSLDRQLHNVSVSGLRNRERNYAQMAHGKILLKLEKPDESVRFRCDVHPWEYAYLTVVEHPFFAVTDENGKFRIPEIPPGEYEVEATHRKAGVVRQRIQVRAGEAVKVEFRFGPEQEQVAR